MTLGDKVNEDAVEYNIPKSYIIERLAHHGFKAKQYYEGRVKEQYDEHLKNLLICWENEKA